MLKLGKNNLQFIVSRKGFSQISHYTTSTTSNVTDYLVNSLGFSQDEAILTSSKVCPFKSLQNPNSVVNFLKANGFNEPQIRKVVLSHPKILSSDVHKTLKPKLEVFQDFGMYGSELTDIISVNSWVFKSSLDKIVQSLGSLKTIFGDDLVSLQVLKKPCWMLSSRAPKNAPSNAALLKSYGFSPDRIKNIFLTKWKYFSIDPEMLHSILIRVEEKIGISRDSAMFFHGVCAISGMTEESLESKFGIFRSFGWSESDIRTLASKNPYSIGSSELRLRTCLNFFMKELGLQPAEIAPCTCAFTVSLEKRVIPRNEVLKVLKKKQLISANYKVLSTLGQSELYFFNRFVLPFKDDLHDVYIDYMAMTRVGASVKKTVP